MDEFKTIDHCYGCISLLFAISIFILSFLNLCFSAGSPKEFETFNYIQLIDYKTPINYNFLMDLNFGSDFIDSDDFGSIGTIRDVCYLGTCIIDFKKYLTYNCSLACLNKINNCYDGENLCDTKECEESWWYGKNKACHEFNRIKLWRNAKIKKLNGNFNVNRYSHIISNDRNCISGYKKCGIINDAKDYLCLKEEYDCPINSIIIKSENEPPDIDYKSYQFGDKFIFFSNKKMNNKLITNFTITLETDKNYSNYEHIDTDYYSNLLEYNPYIYYSGRSKPSIVFLNSVKFETNFTYKDMIKFQEKYETRGKIYTNDTINEMNTEVKKYKTVLLILGIIAFAFLSTIGLYFCQSFRKNGLKDCDCCFCCKEMTPMITVLIFYILYSPFIVLSFLSFYFTIVKKISYDELLTKEYIDEYKNFGKEDFLETSIAFNNRQFITLLIMFICLIVYPILIKISSCSNHFNYKKMSLIN